MSKLDSKLSIPRFLHELHGEKASIFDLLMVYTAALFTSLALLYLIGDLSLSVPKMVIFGFLALDLSGGVAANFTNGTNLYYNEKPDKRYLFIAFHTVQPFVLIWLFPGEWYGISILSLYTLTAVILITRIESHVKQRVLAALLAVIGLTLSFTVAQFHPAIHLLLILFVLKLIVSFSVVWE
jgi:hypothetical protein